MYRSVADQGVTVTKLNASCTMLTVTEEEMTILSSLIWTTLKAEKMKTYMLSTLFSTTVKNPTLVAENFS